MSRKKRSNKRRGLLQVTVNATDVQDALDRLRTRMEQGSRPVLSSCDHEWVRFSGNRDLPANDYCSKCGAVRLTQPLSAPMRTEPCDHDWRDTSRAGAPRRSEMCVRCGGTRSFPFDSAVCNHAWVYSSRVTHDHEPREQTCALCGQIRMVGPVPFPRIEAAARSAEQIGEQMLSGGYVNTRAYIREYIRQSLTVPIMTSGILDILARNEESSEDTCTSEEGQAVNTNIVPRTTSLPALIGGHTQGILQLVLPHDNDNENSPKDVIVFGDVRLREIESTPSVYAHSTHHKLTFELLVPYDASVGERYPQVRCMVQREFDNRQDSKNEKASINYSTRLIRRGKEEVINDNQVAPVGH